MRNHLKLLLRSNKLCLLFLGGIILLLAGLVLWKKIPPETRKQATPSGFQTAIEEARKKEEEKRKAEEEKKRQEEELKKFIAQYGPCRSIPILMYHHVADEQGWLYVRKDYFLSQMDYLTQKGYTTVTLPEVVESLTSGKSLPAKPAVLTFDDGYLDFYENAYPILKSHNFKATIFVITQHLGGANYLSWNQVQEMVSSGLVTAGDHTLSHPSLPPLSEEKLKDQIVSAKNIIEENFGGTVNVFSYPYGGGNGQAEKILKEAGFVAAVTSSRGLSCAKLPYELPRIRIGNAALSAYGL